MRKFTESPQTYMQKQKQDSADRLGEAIRNWRENKEQWKPKDV